MTPVRVRFKKTEPSEGYSTIERMIVEGWRIDLKERGNEQLALVATNDTYHVSNKIVGFREYQIDWLIDLSRLNVLHPEGMCGLGGSNPSGIPHPRSPFPCLCPTLAPNPFPYPFPRPITGMVRSV